MKTIRPIHPNKGIEAKYRKQLKKLIADMNESYIFWLTAGYRKNPPVMAVDELPSKTIKKYLSDLGERWLKNFDAVIDAIVDGMVNRQMKMTSTAFQKELKNAGWAVDFKMTPAMKDIASATISENIALIKSIPIDYHAKVQGAVMRGYAAGHDLQAITKDIKNIYRVTDNRAALIARDQVSKLNSATTAARQQEVGIKQAIWLHSTAGKKPRPDHVKANNQVYDVDKGMLLDDGWVHPGYLINCRCTCRAVLPF